MVDEDNNLVTETLSGRINSFGLLVDKYQNPMFNLAYRITLNYDSAKDITQEAFIKAYYKLSTFKKEEKFFSWIYRITLNECLNYKRNIKNSNIEREDVIDNSDSTIDIIEKEEMRKKINIEINKLEHKYKILILLKHYENLSYEEISDILLIPIGKVKSRLYIAREKLRLTLGDLTDEK